MAIPVLVFSLSKDWNIHMKYSAQTAVTLCLFAFPSAWCGETPKGSPDLLAKGRAAFTVNCVTCHGEKGDGMGPAGKFMNPHPRNWKTGKFKNGDSQSEIMKTVHQGLEGTAMPGFPNLSPDELKGVAEVVRSYRGK
jgi:mono/diheme cytochrome c family protein